MVQFYRRIVFFGLMICWLFQSGLLAQEPAVCPELTGKKTLKKYNEAMQLPRSQSKERYDLLLEVIEEEPEFTEALYVLADINWKSAQTASEYTQEKFYTRAVNYYEKVIETCPAFDSYSAYFMLGKYYYLQARGERKNSFSAAACRPSIQYFRKFMEYNQTNAKDIRYAMDAVSEMEAYLSIIDKPVPFSPVLVKGVSTRTDEFLPMISPDGEFLFYTHRYEAFDKYTTIQKQFEHFKISHRVDDDELSFTMGESLPYPFNQGLKQGAAAITIDNNHIFMTICQFTDCPFGTYNNCDIYSSSFVEGQWTEFRNLGPNVNGLCTWESQPSVSADGKELYFVSMREGNLGFEDWHQTSDIYKSTLDAQGNWTPARNLGPGINTVENEKSPFLHSDSKTLYFSSDGRIGVGRYDIFYSRMDPNGNWLDPMNIGYPINTEDDDIGFMVSTDGRKAYLSSNKLNGSGGYDIYSFDLYEEARPEKVLFVKGQLKDERGDPVTDAKVEMKSARSNRSIEGMVDRMSGKYAVAVSYAQDEEFIMTVKKPDYAFTSRYFRPEEIESARLPLEEVIEMNPIEIGATVKLHNILFDFNSDQFDDASRIILDNFALFMQDNPRLKIALHGHTDNVGGAAINQELSQRRARSVELYLAGKGIATNRLTSKGFGATRPIAGNETESGRALNRRTEFVILEK
jgi:outer membrane protein OmpA-like peptidoglycan-associated protein